MQALTQIPYRQLLLEQSTIDSEQFFGCPVLWDKRLSWERVGDSVELIARMVNQASPRAVKPYVELRYDGRSGDVIRISVLGVGTLVNQVE